MIPPTDPSDESATPEGKAGDTNPVAPAAGKTLKWLAPKTETEDRVTNFSIRLRPSERARVAQAAEALGVSASAYARSRLLGASPDVAAWRGVYQLILGANEGAKMIDLPADTKDAPPEMEKVISEFRDLLRDLQLGFEHIAVGVFPQDDGEG